MEKSHTWQELKDLRDQRQDLIKKPFDSKTSQELIEINKTINNYVHILVNQIASNKEPTS